MMREVEPVIKKESAGASALPETIAALERPLIELTRDVALAPDGGDRHDADARPLEVDGRRAVDRPTRAPVGPQRAADDHPVGECGHLGEVPRPDAPPRPRPRGR